MAALAAVLVMCAAGIQAVSMQVHCVDASREAARLAARGDDADARTVARRLAPPGATVEVRRDGGYVVARVTATSRLLPLLRLPPSQFRRWNPRADGGAATIIAVAMIAVLLAMTAGGAAVGSAVVARHRAQAAADLSALAGRSTPSTASCQRAGRPVRSPGGWARWWPAARSKTWMSLWPSVFR